MVRSDELKTVPFIDHVPQDRRTVYLQPMYSSNTGRFTSYFPGLQGQLTEMQLAGITEGSYWSKELVDPQTDIHIELVHLLANNLSFRKIAYIRTSMENDIQNLGTIIHKQRLLFDCIQEQSLEAVSTSRVYQTEVEYLMGVVRSFHGLLYDVLKELLRLYKRPQMPKTLGAIADKGLDEITAKYKLTPPLVDYFNQIMPLFKECRELRDNIYHRGKEPQIIFDIPKGPGVFTHTGPFAAFRDFIWSDEVSLRNLVGNNIGSLFYFVNKIVSWLLKCSTLFSATLEHDFRLPSPVSNDYTLYMRGAEIRHLNDIQANLAGYWIRPEA